MKKHNVLKIQGMFLIIDRRNLKGLEHWGEELELRGIPAVIQLDDYTINENCNTAKMLADKGFEVGCAYNERPFWDDSFSVQYEIMRRMTNELGSCIGRPIRVFQSKYFGYNEATLQAADKLGIDCVLARGTAGARAVVYKPAEYNTRIISVSNVPSKEMGTGSLCDESLWCRTETPESFRNILFNLKEDMVIVVAQTHLSGVKLNWWNVYQDLFNADLITWESLDEFIARPIVLPHAQIPINTRVDYRTPKPKVPLEQEPDYPFK